VIPNDASIVDAIEAINRALRELKGILQDPPPRALVEALEPDGVKIRTYLWAPTRNVDWFQLLSEAKLKTKVALQQAGVITAEKAAQAQRGKQSEPTAGPAGSSPPAPARAAANLRRDAQAAATRNGTNGNGAATPVDRVLEQPETRVSEEGTNLLKGSRAE
jgi:small conductance mechanosensitive channel